MNKGLRLRAFTALVSLLVAATPTTALADDAPDSEEDTGTSEQTDEGAGHAMDRRTPPFRIALGPLSALRRMTFEGDQRRVVHTPRPYFGGAVAINGTIWRDDDLGASLSYDFDLGYGVGRNTTFEPFAGPTPVTELSYGTGRLLLHRRLGEHVRIGLGGGLRAESVVIQPNPIYTGHRYLAADTSIRVRWFGLADDLDLTGEIGTSPVFSLDNSDAGHGDGSAFGARVETQLRWVPAADASDAQLRNLRVLVRYRYQRFRSQFPVSFLGTNGAFSVDNQHLAILMLEYVIQN